MLVTGVLDKLAGNGRVIVLSSDAHRAAPKGGIDFDNLDGKQGYSGWEAYGRSKLANILFAKQLAKRFQGTARVANSVHPGVIHTNLNRHMNPAVEMFYALAKPISLKTVSEGAATEVWAAVHPDAGRISGEYLADCNVATPRKLALDSALAEKLWSVSEELAHELSESSGPANVGAAP
jgi:WW domain-containing oxidoreductase